jgi:hypothetical protein
VSERSRSVVFISTVVVALLLAATAAAIVVTQHVRDEGPVVSNIFFKRPPGRYRACFFLTRADTVTVELVNATGQVARVLANAQPLQGGTKKSDAHCFDWDGTDAAGNPVPPGPYRLRFELQTADRTATSGEHLVIHTATRGSS